jgi:hypothetical protein
MPCIILAEVAAEILGTLLAAVVSATLAWRMELSTRPSQEISGTRSGHRPNRMAERIGPQTREIHHEKAKRPTI